MKVLVETKFDNLKLFKKGKVRDVYDLGEYLLIVATDRISCFDVVLPTPIPFKGKVLTQLSVFWFEFTKDIIPNHIVTTCVDDFSEEVKKYKEILEGRALLARKTKPIPFECVVRGYLAGGGFKEYKEKGSISGVELPQGLKEAEKLPFPIFTPATKEEEGHDVNVSFETMKRQLGELAEVIKDVSLKIYNKASLYAEERGIIIADTKFEFGLLDGKLILIDEILTPDSSRFWFKKDYSPGRSQFSLDKQFVRDYLEKLDWDKKPPAPTLPSDIVEETKKRYLTIYKTLTGKDL